jgi:hypothetical protein
MCPQQQTQITAMVVDGTGYMGGWWFRLVDEEPWHLGPLCCGGYDCGLFFFLSKAGGLGTGLW